MLYDISMAWLSMTEGDESVWSEKACSGLPTLKEVNSSTCKSVGVEW